MDDEQLSNKKVAGDPATAERAEIRNQCVPTGPVGFLLESLHLQAAHVLVSKLNAATCLVSAK